MPPLLLLRTFIECYQKSSYASISVVMLVGAFFFYFSPEYYFDLYYHYQFYEYYSLTGNFGDLNNYVGLKWLVVFLNYFYLPKNTLILFTTISISGSVLIILNDSFSSLYRKVPNVTIFILFLFIPWLSILSGVRFGSAVFLFFLFIYLAEKNKNYYIFLIIPVCLHFSMIIPAIIVFFTRFNLLFSRKRWFLLSVVLFLLLSGLFLEKVLVFYLSSMDLSSISNVNGYVTGNESYGSVSTLTAGKVIEYLSIRIVFYIIVAFFILDKGTDFKLYYNRFILLMIFFISVTISFATLSGRFIIPTLIFLFLYNKYFVLIFNGKSKYLIPMFLILFISAIHFYGFRKHYINNLDDFFTNYPINHLVHYLFG